MCFQVRLGGKDGQNQLIRKYFKLIFHRSDTHPPSGIYFPKMYRSVFPAKSLQKLTDTDTGLKCLGIN